jgi:hypothetical protein
VEKPQKMLIQLRIVDANMEDRAVETRNLELSLTVARGPEETWEIS